MGGLYGPASVNLADGGETPFEGVSNAFQRCVEWLYGKKAFAPGMLSEKEPRSLIEETFKVLQAPLKDLSIKQEIPPELTAALEGNVFVFSGFKAYHELREASTLLRDESGGFKPFHRFRRDVEAIDNTYNKNYLEAEYEFAAASSQMAVKWKELEKDGDRYNLQYRTAGDDRVRPGHAALNGITLPPSDKFWDDYYPPNGWRCRCTAVQVRKGKHPESDSDEAVKAGERATTQIGKDGTNKGGIFRFNPGKQEKIFPPKHPYYKTPDEAGKEISNAIESARMEKTRTRRKRIKAEAMGLRDESPIVNKQSGLSIGITGGGIDEFLNQPHKHYAEKNEMLLNIRAVIEKSTYMGVSTHKGRVAHIFETELCGEKTYIIATEVKGRGISLYSISDSENILRSIKKPT